MTAPTASLSAGVKWTSSMTLSAPKPWWPLAPTSRPTSALLAARPAKIFSQAQL
jgi:hypothetical protein